MNVINKRSIDSVSLRLVGQFSVLIVLCLKLTCQFHFLPWLLWKLLNWHLLGLKRLIASVILSVATENQQLTFFKKRRYNRRKLKWEKNCGKNENKLYVVFCAGSGLQAPCMMALTFMNLLISLQVYVCVYRLLICSLTIVLLRLSWWCIGWVLDSWSKDR